MTDIDKPVYKMKDSSYIRGVRDKLIREYDNIVQTGLGPKIVGGEIGDEPSIQAYVENKKDRLSSSDIIPRRIDGVRIDVIELNPGEEEFVDGSPARNERIRPLVGGVRFEASSSLSNFNPVRGPDGEFAILGAFHAVDDGGSPAEEVYQPSDGDDNLVSDTIIDFGNLSESDYCLYELTDSDDFSNINLGFGVFPEVLEDPSFDKPCVLSARPVGIIFGDLIGIDLDDGNSSYNFTGRRDYFIRFDEDVDWAGTSGGLYCQYDETDGSFRPFCMVSAVTGSRNIHLCSDLKDIQDRSGFTFDTGDYDGPTSDSIDEGAYFESVAIDFDNELPYSADCLLVNAGGENGDGEVSSVRSFDNSIEDSAGANLDHFSSTIVTLDWPELRLGFLDTTDVETVVDARPFIEGKFPLRDKIGARDGEFTVSAIALDNHPYILALEQWSNKDAPDGGEGDRGAVRVFDRLDNFNQIEDINNLLDMLNATQSNSSVSRDGESLFIGCLNRGDLQRLNISDEDTSNWELEEIFNFPYDDRVNVSTSFSQDVICVSGRGGTARIIDYTTGDEVTEIDTGEFIYSSSFSPSGDYLALGTRDAETERCIIYEEGNLDGTGWNEVVNLDGHNSAIAASEWLENEFLLTGSWDDTFIVYTIGNPDGTEWDTIEQNALNGSVYSFATVEDENLVFVSEGVGSDNVLAYEYDDNGSFTPVEQMGKSIDPVEDVHYDEQSDTVISCGRDSSLRIYDLGFLESPNAPTDLMGELE